MGFGGCTLDPKSKLYRPHAAGFSRSRGYQVEVKVVKAEEEAARHRNAPKA